MSVFLGELERGYRRFIRKFYVLIERLLIVGDRRLLKRKMGILLLGLIVAGLLAIGFISMSNIGIVSVSATQWTGLVQPLGVAIGDYNNDGLNDIAFTELGGKVTVYRSDGTTIIKQWTGLTTVPDGVAIGDYNNDGLNDLAFSELNGGKVTVYKSDGTTIIKQWTGLNTPSCVSIGDYNNDGLNDIAFGEYGAGRVTVYYQTKPGTVARVAEPTIVTLRGTLTNATNGYPILNGSIRVTIKDSMGTQVWQDTFDKVIDNGRYSIPLGTKTTLMLIKGQIYNAILEVDAGSPTFVSADVIYGDNNPAGDIIKFVAN
jgi:hypothetical protein